MKTRLSVTAIAALAFAPIAAYAATGHIVRPTEMMAGPGEYPRVDRIPPGQPVEIFGCTDGYRWCDVGWRDDRGWVRGDSVQYDYQGRRVLVPDAGVDLGIPTLEFHIGDYWDHNYRNRPFYRDRERYEHERHEERRDRDRDHDHDHDRN